MDFSFSFDRKAYHGVERSLKLARGIKWRRRAGNPFQETQKYMFKSTKEKFRAEGISPTGKKKWWKSLSAGYAMWRVLNFGSASPILQLSGKLLKSIKKVPPNKRFVLLRTDIPYGKFQQHGTSRIPSRKFFLWTLTDYTMVRQIFRGWIRGIFTGFAMR